MLFHSNQNPNDYDNESLLSNLVLCYKIDKVIKSTTRHFVHYNRLIILFKNEKKKSMIYITCIV